MMNPDLLAAARDHLHNEAISRQLARQRRLDELYETLPALRELDVRIHRTMLEGLTATLREDVDPVEAIRASARANLGAQEARLALLGKAEIDPASLEPPMGCALCGDKLYVGSTACRCLIGEVHRRQMQALGRRLDVERMNFRAFNLNRFSDAPESGKTTSPRAAMRAVRDSLGEYARGFAPGSKNLFIYDDYAKLGKSFFCACILREVSERGFWVEYDSAAGLFAALEAEKFDRLREEDGDPRRYTRCDLLVLDDLGTEYVTPFVRAALYDLINTRLSERRPMIINSALSIEGLGGLYGPQVMNRIKGGF